MTDAELISKSPARFLRRADAATYVQQRWGMPCSRAWLAKLAVTGGGPLFQKAGKFPVYMTANLDDWAQSRLSSLKRSTSDA